MRILLSYGLVGRGGDAIQVLQIAEALRTLGHEVVPLGSYPLRPYSFSGIEGRVRGCLRRLPWWARDLIELGLDWRLVHQARQVLKGRAFDLIFHRASIYDTAGVRLTKLFNCPLMVWLDAPFPIERAFRGEGYFKALHAHRMRELDARARRIVTVSRAAKEYYVQLGLPEEKICIVPNGVSERLLRQGQELAHRYPPFSRPSPWVIGFAGSLSRWHRVDLLLEAVRSLQDPRWRVTIVGYGEEHAQLRLLTRTLNLDNTIEWLGALPHEQAFAQIAQFDIAVLPHTLPTGAPMKLFEYAALARPTIAPDLPNLRELFSEDEMLFVEPGNPKALAKTILWLAQHPEKAAQLGRRAQARVRGYCWEEMLKKLLASIT